MADNLYKAFNECFYDEKKGLYIDGLNDEYEEKKWLPKNSEKKYFSINSDIPIEITRVRMLKIPVEPALISTLPNSASISCAPEMRLFKESICGMRSRFVKILLTSPDRPAQAMNAIPSIWLL